MYIISKLEVENFNTEVIFSSENHDDCKAKLLDIVQKTNTINKIINKGYIQCYAVKNGWITTYKSLESIYQILKVPDIDNDNDDDDGDI